jgi:hypothetical protein
MVIIGALGRENYHSQQQPRFNSRQNWFLASGDNSCGEQETPYCL